MIKDYAFIVHLIPLRISSQRMKLTRLLQTKIEQNLMEKQLESRKLASLKAIAALNLVMSAGFVANSVIGED